MNKTIISLLWAAGGLYVSLTPYTHAADSSTSTTTEPSAVSQEEYDSIMSKLDTSMTSTVTTSEGDVTVNLTAKDTILAGSKTVSVAQLVQDTIQPQCIKYRLNGVCFWLYCHYGCSIKTSISVSHYNPDVIVETISEDTTTPVEWLTGLFDSAFNSIAKSIMGYAVGTGVKRANKHSSRNFYDVNVYGNPALLVYRDVVGSMMDILAFCKSSVQPFQPYFSSKLSPDWRMGLGEALLAVMPTNYTRALEASSQDIPGSMEAFGDIYPRTGGVNQDNRFLGSMVIAQRAANIVGGSPGIHIATPLPNKAAGYKTWGPKDIKEGNADISMWQRNFPRGNSTCRAFPVSMTTSYPYDSGDYSPTQNYLYTLWRKWECCKIRGKFIQRVTY